MTTVATGQGADHGVVEVHRLLEDLREPPPAHVAAHHGPRVERVDEPGPIPVLDPQHEVGRQVDPGHRKAQRLGHGPVDDRQADRDPQPSVEHLVEIAVARVVVLLVVAAQLLLDEEHPVDLAEDVPHPGAAGASGPDPLGQFGDAAQVELDLQAGMGVGGDLQRDPGQVHGVLARGQSPELGAVGERMRRHAAVLRVPVRPIRLNVTRRPSVRQPATAPRTPRLGARFVGPTRIAC